MFTIGWTGEAAAASLTIDLKYSFSMPLPKLSSNLHTRHPGAVLPPVWRDGMGRVAELWPTSLLRRSLRVALKGRRIQFSNGESEAER
jgi:hypothetical protein